ncbi:zinc finger domain-containing protein [Tsukamurella soli]|uniref:DNA-binding phage zinc finger domain-containing protein n=1 Tax=Tsukamurella soli TaxID=644556 RepID=A0ABP8J6L4_9ACTN
MARRFRTLTDAVAHPDTTLRRYLDGRFPYVRPIQDAYRAAAGPMLVPPGEAPSGTVGAAFDAQLRFTLDPAHTDTLATRSPDLLRRQVLRDAVAEAVALAGPAAAAGDEDTAARASWVYALGTELYRNPRAKDGSPLREFFDRPAVTAADLLALAPPDALRQLSALAAVARERLLPHLHGDLRLGVEFDGSQLCRAEADVISGGLLLEVKARRGKERHPRGSDVWYDDLPGDVLHQLLGYLLFDRSDTYRIDRIGVYSARYGTFAVWDVGATLAAMAGEPVDLAAERAQVWRILEAEAADRAARTAVVEQITVLSCPCPRCGAAEGDPCDWERPYPHVERIRARRARRDDVRRSL